jgi:hypothetical protein
MRGMYVATHGVLVGFKNLKTDNKNSRPIIDAN